MSHLLEGCVKNHLFRLTLPSIGGMFAVMVLNLTDTFFVARLGTDELAAMGFTFAVIMMIGSLAIGFSSGATSIVTRALGSKNFDLAKRTVSDGLVLTFFGTILISIVGYFTITPLFELLGAEGRVLDLVRDYMQIWFLGAVFCVVPPVSDGCLRATGDMVRPLQVMCIISVINLILDPILIYGVSPLGIPAMGIAGAAWATLFARVVGGVLSVTFLHKRTGLIDWHRPHLNDLIKSSREIVRLGIPSALNQVLMPISQAFFTKMAASVAGVQGVAAVAAATRIESLALIVAIAYSIALTPLLGQNYGAGMFKRVNQIRVESNRLSFYYAAACLIIFALFGRLLTMIFSDDQVVIRLSYIYLVVTVLGMPGFNVTTWTSQMLNTAGHAKAVMAINLIRVFVFIIPICYIGKHFGGYVGLVIGIFLGNSLSGFVAGKIGRKYLKA